MGCLLALPLLLSCASSALACSCAEKPSLENALERADVVFLGKVTQISKNALRPGQAEIRFEVRQLFKDAAGLAVPNIVVLYTAEDESLCGYKFSPYQEYLVFATGNPAKLTTNICSRNGLFDGSRKDIETLQSWMPSSAASSL